MTPVQVEYEAFQSLRRRAVTLLCFALASSLAMGIGVYVDSYSLRAWDTYTDIGPVSMMVHVNYGTTSLNEFSGIQSIEHIAICTSWDSEVLAPSSEYSNYMQVSVLDDTLLAEFPDVFDVVEGRLPLDASEIALDSDTRDYMTGIALGQVVNVSGFAIDPYAVDYYRSFTIVGFWQYPYQSGYWSPLGGALVRDVEGTYTQDIVVIDIDRNPVSPFDTAASLAYLSSIETAILKLDPTYDPLRPWSGQYYIYDILASAVQLYAFYRLQLKLSEFMRASGALLLVVFVMLLAIRHNLNERRYEADMLVSRGAPISLIDRIVLKEMVLMSFLGGALGLGLGIVLSRIGFAAEGFLEYDLVRIWTEPFLVTSESLLLSAVVGIILPMLTYFFYRSAYSTKRRAEKPTGKLAKVARFLSLIRWDILLIGLSVVVLVISQVLRAELRTSFILSGILGLLLLLTPLALFIGVFSVFVKVLRMTTELISRGFSRIVGKVPAAVGIRRIGREASSAAPTAIVLALAISLAWTSAIISVSAPQTKLDQARYAFGSDLSFHLSAQSSENWTAFASNVTNHPSVEAATLLSIAGVLLSADYWDSARLVALNPIEYMGVGYDEYGLFLNESVLAGHLGQLEFSAAGAVITADIAYEYDLGVGDVFRTFSYEGAVVFSFSILAVVNALPNAEYTDTGTDSPYSPYFDYSPYYIGSWMVGGQTIWVNRAYLPGIANITEDLHNVLCVRTSHDANSTQVGEEILAQSSDSVLDWRGWCSATKEVTHYTGRVEFLLNLSIDNLLTAGTILTILGAFSVYAAEGLQARRREIALARAMGAERRMVIGIQTAEMLALAFASLILLAFVGPVLALNSLLTMNISYYSFPVAAHVVVPWPTLAGILGVFIVSVVVFVAAVASLASRVKLSSALNAAWAESAPFGGDV